MVCTTNVIEAIQLMENLGFSTEAMFRFLGEVYRMSDLPRSYNERRWTIVRKQLVAAAVISGSLSEEVAKERYRMLQSELQLWCRSLQELGPAMLSTSYAYNETKGEGWIFPESERFLSGSTSFGGHHFQHVSQPQNRDSLLLQLETTSLLLTVLESDVLKVLIRYQDMVVPSEMLMCYRLLHRRTTPVPDSKLIDVAVCKLRKKLQLANLSECFETVWGRGYLLQSPPTS